MFNKLHQKPDRQLLIKKKADNLFQELMKPVHSGGFSSDLTLNESETTEAFKQAEHRLLEWLISQKEQANEVIKLKTNLVADIVESIKLLGNE